MDIAKILRNVPINKNNKTLVCRAITRYLRNCDPHFDYKRFTYIVTGEEEGDFRTDAWSKLELGDYNDSST